MTPFEVSADGATSTAVAHAVKEIDEGMHLQPMPETTVVTRGMNHRPLGRAASQLVRIHRDHCEVLYRR